MPRNLGRAGFAVHQVLQGSSWTQTQTGASSTVATLNVLRAVPFLPGRSGALNAVALNVTAIGGSSNVIRFGIYNHDYSTGLPGTLAGDFGTVSSTTTGIKQITGLSTTIENRLYWLCAVSQVGTSCTMRALTGGNPMVGQSAATPSDILPGCYETAATVTGALPASFTVSASGVAAPAIFVRLS